MILSIIWLFIIVIGTPVMLISGLVKAAKKPKIPPKKYNKYTNKEDKHYDEWGFIDYSERK